MPSQYHYRSSVGTLWIRQQHGSTGRWVLGVDETPLGTYQSAEAAADDVRGQHTGWPDWDSNDTIVAPRELSEWADGPAAA